ncbi:YvrJ family protein [Halobacillus shinanisalinarum]|uniref:YvrJ family protein n=1 Tax=Halobacillus shinanisalinarum TaxID=2932258 RepID=A0ABY4GV99_9BACI|nr:YvrJ family protein [Halobacillus shinanisalinarum]UOQ92095.1 YvrJ family protein [Halobacillus shinanisalinarum]
MMTIESWITLAGNVGFPVVVSFFLLFRLDQCLHNLDKSIDELTKEVRKKDE